MTTMKKTLAVALVASSAAAGPAFAQSFRLSFSATVLSSANTPDYPAVGNLLTGSIGYSYDPSSYSVHPFEPTLSGYEYLPGAASFDVGWPGGGRSADRLGIEVSDNGSTIDPTTFPSDTALFSTKIQNVSYDLKLTGANTSFVGTAIPTAATLVSFRDLAELRVFDNTSQQTRVVARVDTVGIAAVPEPEVPVLFALGLLASWAHAAVVGSRCRMHRCKVSR